MEWADVCRHCAHGRISSRPFAESRSDCVESSLRLVDVSICMWWVRAPMFRTESSQGVRAQTRPSRSEVRSIRDFLRSRVEPNLGRVDPKFGQSAPKCIVRRCEPQIGRVEHNFGCYELRLAASGLAPQELRAPKLGRDSSPGPSDPSRLWSIRANICRAKIGRSDSNLGQARAHSWQTRARILPNSASSRLDVADSSLGLAGPSLRPVEPFAQRRPIRGPFRRAEPMCGHL